MEQSKQNITAQTLLTTWKTDKANVPVLRKHWDVFFLEFAHKISERSIDAQTHCGCVIVDKHRHIIGTGYNSFIAGIDDSVLPNTRPEKYPFMIHAELNAILNCSKPPSDATAYVTGHPCPHCYQCLWQVGIRCIVYNTNHHTNMQQDPKVQAISDILHILTPSMIMKGIDL